MDDQDGLLYRSDESAVEAAAAHSRQVVLELPEGVDTSEGVIMQIDGDKIHIITQGAQLDSNPLGIAMESIMQAPVGEALAAGEPELQIVDAAPAGGGELPDSGGGGPDPDGRLRLPAAGPARLQVAGEAGGGLQTQLETESGGAELAEPVPCFVCEEPCRRPARLLLARTAGSGGSLAERLAALLPVRLHVSALDGVCDRCRQLLEQADHYHSRLKDVELKVRQLFRLEEKLEDEERRREQEQEAARLRRQELARRRELEQRREEAHRPPPRPPTSPPPPLPPPPPPKPKRGRGRPPLHSTANKAVKKPDGADQAELFPFAADDDFDSGDEAADVQVVSVRPPTPEDAQDEDWTPRQRAGGRPSLRRRRPRRPWSPSDSGSRRTRRRVSQADQQEVSKVQSGTAADAEEHLSGRDQDQESGRPEEAADAEDDLPEGVTTTTIEFVSIDGRPDAGDGNGLVGAGSRPSSDVPQAHPSFYCRRCETQFSNSSDLVAHIRLSHTRPWCRRCRREFADGAALRQHRRQCRSRCPVCGQLPADLERHLRTQHPERRPPGRARSRRLARGPAAPSGPPPPPKVIEFSSVSTLREQVKHVKTAKCSLKFRRVNSTDLDKIQHLNVEKKTLSAGPQAPRSHTCLRCGEHLTTLKDQIEHLHTVHKGKFWCRRCRTEFDDKQAIAAHRPTCKKLTTEGECGRCGKHVKHLKMHLRRHDQPNKRKGESVMGPDGKMVSASLAGGVCTVCKKYIAHRLKRHVASHIQHPCPICKKLFSREDVIAGHIKRVHMKERPHICNDCGKSFVSLYSLQRHEMIHTNSYRFYCQECGDGFRQKQQLTAHMRHKHGVMEIEFEDVTESTILGEMAADAVTADLRFYCQECGAGFHSRRQLTGHMRRKHGVANVVFEDVQLHVADGMDQLEAVAVTEEVPEPAEPAAAGHALPDQESDPAAGADERQDWWGGDQTAAY